MEQERIFRVSEKHRKHPIIVLAIFFLASILIIIITKPASKSLVDHMGYIYDLFGGWFLIYMGSMALIFMILFVVEYGYYRLVFTDTYFMSRGFQINRSDRPQIIYSNVTRIIRSAFGNIRIDTRDGKTYPLNIKRLEGGSKKILEEFKKHIPENRFEEGLEERIDKITKVERFVIVGLVLAILFIFVDMFYEDIYEGIKNEVAWTMEIEGSWEDRLEDVILGEDGAIWVLARAYPGEWDDPEVYEVRKYSEGEIEAMRLPSFEELFPEGKPDRGFTFPDALFLGKNELPELEFFLGLRKLLWTGSSWEWGAEPEEDADDKEPVDYLAERTGDDYWIKMESDRIISVKDPETGEVEEVTLDDRDDYYWLKWVENAHYGWTVVILSGPEDRKFIYSFKNNEDEKQWYELEMPSLPPEEYARIHDYTVDSAGNIYVLVRGQESCKEGAETSHIGRLDHKNGAWEWRTVKHKDECIFGSQQQLLIDPRGRIWLPATTSVAVVAPIIFEKESVLEEDITIYTEENSRYLIGHQITVGPDGRFWSLDMSGHGLVWIDPDVDEIERPISSWIAELVNSSSFSWGMSIASFGLFLASMIFLIIVIRKGNPPSKKLEI